MIISIGVRNAVITFLVVLSTTYFLSNEDILQRFMPRSKCMFNNQKLIILHLISDAVIFISYIGIGLALYKIYGAVKTRSLPFSDFIWQFSAFIIFCGISHLVGVLNLYVTFYWLDGIIKLLTAWFSILVFIHLVRDLNKIRSMRTPQEFEELRIKLNELLIELKIKNATP